LKLLLLSFNLPDEVATSATSDVLARYWRRSLFRAEAARRIAERFSDVPRENAYVMGLLSELGILALIQQAGQPYVELLSNARWASEELLSQERQAFGFDHAQLTARLTAEWRLPGAPQDDMADHEAEGEAVPPYHAVMLEGVLPMADCVT